MKRYISALTMVLTIGLLSAGTVALGGETTNLSVEGMTCQGCVDKVESAVKKVDGVESVDVDLQSNTAKVTYASAANLTSIEQAIADAGFQVKTADATSKSMEGKAGKTCGDDSDCCSGDKSKGKDI